MITQQYYVILHGKQTGAVSNWMSSCNLYMSQEYQAGKYRHENSPFGHSIKD